MALVDRIADPWGSRTPYARGESWPTRVDTYLADGLTPQSVDRWVQSASVLHSNGDGLDIAVKDAAIVGVRGREDDRVNHGRVDPKDLYGWRANASRDRLTSPLIRRGDELVETDWDTAMEAVVRRSRTGQPGSYTDVDHADVIALFGHNVAETQTVLWMRMLDRLAGADPPAIICVDPRSTPSARHATVHLSPLPGTNVALMNGLLHEIVHNGWYDADYVDDHAVGFEELQKRVAEYPPDRVARICGVPAGEIQRAAELIGTATALLSTVLQGFYQSHQATAASVQVNNIHILRGMLGKPGCGILQMNGQPTAENTRECGADGDLAGFRNWSNDKHIEELATLWNLNPQQIPHYASPTQAMQMLRYAEQGSLRMLWVSATNPAVSLPELARIRRILADDRLFLVVQDIFRTETAELADIVLPAAAWAEKTGTFTNADRTVHLSEKAVDPPEQARTDLDIFLDYARRMDFRDKDDRPFPPWSDAESAFEAWSKCSAGRPCDYTGLSYDKLRGGSGIQWPCNTDHPDGTERLYADGKFWSEPQYCEAYGKDLVTGAPLEPTEYRALNPYGKAIIKAAEYLPPHERPSAEYPFVLITGRTVYHFHTRTKTARAPELQDAAPEVWLEVSAADAEKLAIGEGDSVEVVTPRGSVAAGRRRGPRSRSHYHRIGSRGRERAANHRWACC